MKLIALLTMAAGFLLAIFTLRVVHGQFEDVGPIFLSAAIPNALTGLVAYILYRRRSTGITAEAVLLVVGYIVGVVGGAYIYFT